MAEPKFQTLPENLSDFLPQDCMNEIYSQYKTLKANVTEVWIRVPDKNQLLPNTLLVGLNGKKLALDRVHFAQKNPPSESEENYRWYHTCPQGVSSVGSNYPMLALGPDGLLESSQQVFQEDLGYTHGLERTLPSSISSCALKITFWIKREMFIGDFAIYYDMEKENVGLTDRGETSPFFGTRLYSPTRSWEWGW